MSAYKILFNLSPCLEQSQSSVHLDACNLFNMLSKTHQVELNGLLYAKEGNLFIRNKQKQVRAAAVEQAHYFLHEAFNHEAKFLTGILSKLRLKQFFVTTKKQYDLYPIDVLFNEVIWRNIFNANLSAQWQKNIFKSAFYFTDMTQQTWSTLNTENYDFAIFPAANPMRVTGKTTKIIRFQDPIALTDPDFSSRNASNQVANYLKQASQDSYFVCDTDVARKKLVSLYSHLQEKSCVIPSAILFDHQKINDKKKLNSIIATRLINTKNTKVLREKLNTEMEHDYILTMSSMKPEENIVTLIHAWEKLNYQHQRNMKLIIVTNTDVIPKDIENAMRPHLEKGSLFLLAGLPEIEKAYLYSHATVFVSVAYTENNYFPLLSAMHYECPTVVSSIPVHHWVMSDASLYCDPYSEDSIAETLAKALYSSDAQQLKKELISRGIERVKSFSPATIAPQWLKWFDKIKKKTKMAATTALTQE